MTNEVCMSDAFSFWHEKSSLQIDAERYRWWRAFAMDDNADSNLLVDCKTAEELDAAIDAAMKSEKWASKTAFEKDDAFRRGARAFFDRLMFISANHWHANPEIQAQSEKENAYLISLAEEALEEVSPADYATYVEINKLLAENALLKSANAQFRARLESAGG